MAMLHYEFISAADRSSRRLLIMLHGLGDSIEGYRWLPPTLNLPWLNYALVNAPDDYYGGYSWFDFPENSLPGIQRSYGLLVELLTEFRGRGYAPEQTTLGGFSQGCVMAVEVGMRYPHRLAGIVGLSGRVSDPAALVQQSSPVARQQRFLITHGTMDPVIPFGVAEAHAAALREAGMNVAWFALPKPHTIAEEELSIIRQFVTAGYPGGRPGERPV
jgi:phospholipase/carboxylesterase